MVRLTREPLSLEEARRAVRSRERGAVVLFCGDVRDREDGRPIAAIAYEAYEPLALKELERAAAAAAERHGAAVWVAHRLGPVPAGETSLIVAAAAPHRPEAFAACREVLERVKARAPIWKAQFVAAERA